MVVWAVISLHPGGSGEASILPRRHRDVSLGCSSVLGHEGCGRTAVPPSVPWRMDRPLSVTSCVGSGWMGQSRHAREITHGTLATVSRRHQGSSVDVRRFPSDPLCYTLYMGWRSGAQIHVSNLGASGCNSCIPGVNLQRFQPRLDLGPEKQF